MEERNADVVIVGGGASGLAAAVELGMSAPGLDVLVIEKMDEPGRKLRATGSGRCNISNTAAAGYTDIMRFFTRIGLVTRTYDNGLVYPHSESAADVVKLLVSRAEELGVQIFCGEEVTKIQYDRSGGPHVRTGRDDSSCVRAEQENVHVTRSPRGRGPSARFAAESVCRDGGGEHHIITRADYLILACGGKAGPMYGTTGDGYRFAREMGHSIVTPVPALTGIECEEWSDDKRPCAKSLAGTRTAGCVSLYRPGGKGSGREGEIFKEEGEIQFTRYGLSGICVFNMTRHMRYDRAAGESLSDFAIAADLYPDGDIREYIRDRQHSAFAGAETGTVLRTVLKENIAEYVMGRAEALRSPAGRKNPAGRGSTKDRAFNHTHDLLVRRPVSQLSGDDIEAIARSVHALEFHPSGIRGWRDAQVTMGGVALDEIDEAASQSKLTEGLYITGELADRDFRCGGYNLSNAWLTGLAAAADIAGNSERTKK